MPPTLPAEISRFLLRELATLRREMEAYPEEEMIWRLPAGAPNSTGTLVLHVCGNLQHYVGAILGGTAYVRDREREFSDRDVPRKALLKGIEATEQAVSSILPSLPESVLNEDFPEPLRGQSLSTREVLLQAAVHLAYHLGQVSYHRRLLTGDVTGVDALSPLAL
jgi:hypothetical protein